VTGWPPGARLLAGKTAFVTGASRGIGRAVAETLAALGADVALGGVRDPDGLAQAAAELAARHGVRTLALPGDVADPAAVRASYQAIFKAWKQLDVLVNNAGVLEGARIGMIDDRLVERVLATNAGGAIHHLQGAARLMGRAKRGAIINVSSIMGVRGDEGQAVYAASKAAVIGLTLAAAKELAPQGIRVNAVAPGYIATDMIAGLAPEVHAQRLGQIGLGRVGTAAEVADVIAFLASDLAAYVTGQVIGIDGGMRI
jgi:3-oxoacyl-[acyl-carrier protein] reductase